MRTSAALAIAVCLVLAAPTPKAQTAPPAQSEPQAQTTLQPQAQTSLAQAVRAAEQRSGGRARKVELESNRGAEVFEVKTVSKDKSASVMIDPASGNVVRVEGDGFMASVFDRDDQRESRAEFARLEGTPMTLAVAIEAAEKETGARAIEAAMKSQYGSTVFEVKLVKDWTASKVWVDPGSSKVIPVPQKQKHYDD